MKSTHPVPNRLPSAGAGFFWETDRIPHLRPETERAVAKYTTRLGGVSKAPYETLNLSFDVGDETEAVEENRRVVGEGWNMVHQVHGAEVVRASSKRRDADGQWTTGAKPMAVLSADCVLLLLVGPERLGVAHAGWRGLVAGVVENAVEATGATEVFAGPAIGPCCFEVGAEVITSFSERFGPAAIADSRHVDLWVAAELAATRAGAKVVRSARLCTSCHPELFFSHRRDKGRTGRQGLIARIADA